MADAPGLADDAPAPPLYAASVPVFLHYLARLEGLLTTARLHLRAQGLAEAPLLQARLAPDMLPLAMQVMVAAQFARRACCPLAGQPVPPWPGVPEGLEALAQQVAQIRRGLQALRPQHFAAAAGQRLQDRAGQADIDLPAADFLQRYALPNFFFHLSMVHALLRHQGVPVGKADFDGLHRYAAP